MSAPPFTFHRAWLAEGYADALMGRTPFDHSSGLFLAAPRRTGKSFFLRMDLAPELEKRGVTTIYVDLWANKQADPGVLIIEGVKAALRNAEAPLVKAVRKAGLTRLGLGSFITFDIDRIGTPQGATLSEALTALAKQTGKTVALIVDEAQHALGTDEGVNAMFALKAARDAMNQSGDSPNLLLVFSGSHRDKLANLVLRRDQPFFGAHVSDLPLLQRDFTDAYTARINERLAEHNRFEPDDVFRAFTILGHRPEMLDRVLKDFAFGPSKADGLKHSLSESAGTLQERLWDEFDSEYGALTSLQQAVLERLIEQGDRFAPFTADSLAAYSGKLGRPVEASDAQAAIDGLRQKNLVWRAGRGSYALEDQGMVGWLLARKARVAAVSTDDDPGGTATGGAT